MTASLRGRMAGVDALREVTHDVAVEVTAQFLHRHPDWVERLGHRARAHGEQDAMFHMGFLAASLANGSAEAFADYAQWTSRVLDARGIPVSFLNENLRDVGEAAKLRLPDLAPEIEVRIEGALVALERPHAPRSVPLAVEAELFCAASLGGGRAAAVGVAREALRGGASLLDVYADVLEASQHEVGRRWTAAEITVADEHRATAVAQFVLACLYAEMPVQRPVRGRGVVTGVLGERHQMGANMVADGLESDGWDIIFLGTDLPHSDIVEAVEGADPCFVGISVSLPANLPALVDLVERLRGCPAGQRAQLMVGGNGLQRSQQLAQELGSHGPVHDVRAAVRLGREVEQQVT